MAGQNRRLTGIRSLGGVAHTCHAVYVACLSANLAVALHYSKPQQGGDLLTVKLRNVQDLQYHGDFTIGGQVLSAIYDTGSFDVLALSSHCQSCTANTRAYSSNQSSSFQSSGGGTMQLEFGSGTVHARQDTDTVRIGGVTSPQLVDNMPFWQVLDHDLDFWNTDAGGQFAVIAGLGHPDQVPQDLSGPRRDALLGRLNISRFAFCLPQQSGAAGWLTFGPIETPGTLFKTVPLISGTYYWIPELTGERIGSGEVIGSCEPACAALIDSGSSVILVPPAVMNALEKNLGNVHGVSCTQISHFPNLEFVLGGMRVVLPPSAYMVEDGWSWCIPAIKSVARTSPWGPVWSLGLPFLRQYYTVFDRVGPSLHLAEAAEADCAATVAHPSIAASALAVSHPPHPGALPALPGPAVMAGSSRSIRMPTWMLRHSTVLK